MDIDTKGVTWEVTNEFKARNQMAAGFEQTLCGWLTTNKSVDCISSIYHNQQRFANYTWDAVRGIGEPLGPMSKTAWKNRLMLEVTLEGVVCVMLGG